MTKITGSGSESGSRSISQRHGSADPDPGPDPDPHQNVMDPQHTAANHTQLHSHPSNLLLGHDDNLFYKKTMHCHTLYIPLRGSFFSINRRNYRKFTGKDDTSHCGVVAKWLALLQRRLRRFDSWPGAFGGLFDELHSDEDNGEDFRIQ
jgi:hypothetical protein